MGVISGLAIFFVIWWTVLFAILPLGVRTQADDELVLPGSAPSAPTRPRMRRKMMQTTVAALVVFIVFYVATQIYGIGPQSFPHIIPGT